MIISGSDKKITSDPSHVYALFIIFFVSSFILASLTMGFVWPLYLLAMGVGFFLSVKHPQSGLLAMVVLTIIFERFFTLQPVFFGKHEYKLYPIDIVMLGIMAGIGKEIFLKGTWRESWAMAKGKSSGALLLFILLNAVYFFASVFFLGSDFSASFSTLKNYAFYSLLYFCSLWLVSTREDLEKVTRFFFLGAAGILVFIIAGVIRGQGLWSEYTPLSTIGIRTLAFTHGLYLSLILIPALLYLVFKKSSQQMYVLIGIWMIGIAGTMMRHLWIALALSGVMVYFFMTRKQKMMVGSIAGKFLFVIAAAGLATFYGLVLFPQSDINATGREVIQAFEERVSTLTYLDRDESYAWRSVVWHDAYEQYKRHPFFGIGTGKRISVELGSYRDFVEVKNLHNSYLAILIQFGVAGLAVFLYFIWTSIADLVRSFGNNARDWYQLSILGILGVYLAAFVFQPYLETNLLSVFFWMSLGVGKSLGNNYTK